MLWALVVEDKNDKKALITEPMHSSMENGHFDKVPILIGYNSEEIVTRIRSKYKKILQKLFLSLTYILKMSSLLDSVFQYTGCQ